MRYKLYLLMVTFLTISACSSVTYTPPPIPTETPVMSMTSITPLLRCGCNNLRKAIQRKVNQNERLRRFLVVITPSDFLDGTVKNGSISDGKFFDVGYLQLKAIFTSWFPRDAVVITVDDIPFLSPFGHTGSIVLGVGGIKRERYEYLKKVYKVDDIYRLTGSFYKMDGEIPLKDSGYAVTAESKGTDASGGVSFGNARNTNVVGMNVILGRIDTNEAIASTIIEARVNKRSTELQFKFNWLEEVSRFTGGSFSKKFVLAEGIHGAQHSLLEAAALWFMGMSFGQDARLNVCLNSPSSDPMVIAEHAAKLAGLSTSEKIIKIQEMLVKKELLPSEEYEAGKLDQATKKAIRQLEINENRYETPHIEKTLDALYLILLTDQGK
ncbi:MAG: hypothetical protein HC877_17630 [Thioploca sp.]|nr:hypothetical protein [Thioploca sp.]